MKGLRTYLAKLRGNTVVAALPHAAFKRGETLCDFCCAKLHCSIKRGPVQSCEHSILPIKFQSMKGMEGRFSTIRMGGAWIKRVKTGSVIAIYSTTSETIEGYAEVQAVVAMKKHDALQLGAINNHTVDRNQPLRKRYHSLGRTVRNSYGSYSEDPEKTFCHIELRRLKDDEVKRLEAAWPMDSVGTHDGPGEGQ